VRAEQDDPGSGSKSRGSHTTRARRLTRCLAVSRVRRHPRLQACAPLSSPAFARASRDAPSHGRVWPVSADPLIAPSVSSLFTHNGVRVVTARSAWPRSGAFTRAGPRRRTRVGHVGKQRHLAGPLHRDGDLPLVAAARARDAAVADLAPLRDVAPKLVDVLVVHLSNLVLAKQARLAPQRFPRASGTTGARSRFGVLPRSRLCGHHPTLQVQARPNARTEGVRAARLALMWSSRRRRREGRKPQTACRRRVERGEVRRREVSPSVRRRAGHRAVRSRRRSWCRLLRNRA